MTAPEIIYSNRADDELRQIWRYITLETQSPDAADALLLRIDDKIQRLRDFPDRGAPRRDISLNARMLVEGSFLILYEHIEDENIVEIVSVVNGRRDLTELY